MDRSTINMTALTQRELVSETSKLLMCVGQVPVVVTELAHTASLGTVPLCQGCHPCSTLRMSVTM